MRQACSILLLTLFGLVTADLNGPFIFWGHEKVSELQPRALLKTTEENFENLYQDAKAVIIFIRNSSSPLESKKYPKFRESIKENAWTYLPQRILKTDPVNYNTNVEFINLYGDSSEEEEQLLKGYNDALTIYGPGEVLGIFASREEDSHFLRKREVKGDEPEAAQTTAQPISDDLDKSFIYVADGNKAVLSVAKAPVLNISKESMILEEHNKATTFDNQKAKGYGRLIIVFNFDNEKVFVRFNFSWIQGTWTMKACEVELKDYKTVLPIVGNEYTVPSAPEGFSYRCGSRSMIFSNGNETLNITDYQIQPWLNGTSQFGPTYDCIGFITTPILAGILVTFFLCLILSLGLVALLEIKTPNRFESSRNKQLTFTVQE